jgi:hypothetical protein
MEGNVMNKYGWGGIVIWGIFVTCFGLGTMNPTSAVMNSAAGQVPDQEVIFLLSGGIVTCLIGIFGLIGCMGLGSSFNRSTGAVVRYLLR